MSGRGATGAGTMLSMVAMIGYEIGKPLDEMPANAEGTVNGVGESVIHAVARTAAVAAASWNAAVVATISGTGRRRLNSDRIARIAAVAIRDCSAW